MALVECEHCGQMISDKAKACPKCGNIPQVECISMDTSKSEVEANTNESIIKNRSVSKVIVLVLVMVSVCIGGVSGYFLHSNSSTNNEQTLSDGEVIDSITTDENLLKNGSYYWLLPSQFPVVYELKDGVIKNAYINYYPLEAKISHGEYFKGRTEQIFPNGQKMELYIQFKLRNGEGYIEQNGNRTNITMYKVSIPSEPVNDIIQSYKNNYEAAMRNAQSEVVDESVIEAEVCDTAPTDY